MPAAVDKTATSAAVALSTKPRTPLSVWLALAAFVIVFAPTVVWLWGRWTMSVWQNAHGLLIPPVVAYFVREELQTLRHLPRSSSAWGFAILLPALALHALDTGMHTELLSAGALMLAMPGLSLLMLGVQRTKAILVPLLFLMLSLPIPLSFTERIHLALRHIATAGTAGVVPWLGVPVFAEGTTLHLAQGPLQVADACSGFSTLYAAVAVALLTAYQSASPTRRVVVLLAAAPIAIASNLLRVILLVVLVAYVNPNILETWVHPASGIMTFALALPVIFWLGGEQRQRAPREVAATGAVN